MSGHAIYNTYYHARFCIQTLDQKNDVNSHVKYECSLSVLKVLCHVTAHTKSQSITGKRYYYR